MWLGNLSALASALVWASVGVVGKALLQRFPLSYLYTVRLLVAAACALITLSALGTIHNLLAIPPLMGLLFLGASLMGVVGEVFFFIALERDDASRVVTASGGLTVLLSVLASALLLGEPVGWGTVLGAALVLGGVYLIMARGPGLGLVGWQWQGLLYSALTAVMWTGGTLGFNYGLEAIDPFTGQVIRNLPLGLAMALLLLRRRGRRQLQPVTWRDYALLAVTGVQSFGWTTLWFLALQFTTVANTTILASTSPLFTVAMAYLWLRERLGLRGVAGALVTVLGIWATVSGAG